MMKIFYHRDADGKGAGYIARYFITKGDIVGLDSSVECISINYNEEFPIDRIREDEGVVIVDFSLNSDVMSDLVKKTHNVIWIDHHISAIEKLDSFKHVRGLRSVDFSGCELTWLYFNNKIEGHNIKIEEKLLGFCPKAFRLIGDRDVWRFQYGDKSRWFHEAFKLMGEPCPEDEEAWKNLTSQTDELLKSGKLLCEHTAMINKAFIDNWAYEAYLNGYRILVCNSAISGSEIGDRIKDYPFVAVYCHNGKNWTVSLYSESMDIVEIAKERGGGGHPRACGFTSDKVPFERIYKI
ncbi:MAG: hypothetical protein P8Y23_19155 [Candidatus Lokiarchaeota archaeon]